MLVLGDLHIPHRADAIPPQLKELLVPGKMHHVLCTGNVCSKATEEYLRTLANSVHIVRGDMDLQAGLSDLPDHKVLQIGEFTVGLTHGHLCMPWGDTAALAALQRQLDVDILITGHTHKADVYECENKYIVNPGSVTGAFSSATGEVSPSFALLAIKDRKVVTWVYELRDGEVTIAKSEFIKQK